MRPDELDFELPPERIAQVPVEPRDAARLLIVPRDGGPLRERRFAELAAELGPHDVLVVNDTRVRPARLRGAKASGGRAEALLVERRPDGQWLAFVRTSGRLRPGLELRFGPLRARVTALRPDGSVRLALDGDAWLDQVGEAPLPPYIRRDAPRARDLDDYQSVFARAPGAIAAPTASLHFTRELAARLPLAYVTLHVGPGTFRPVRADTYEDHALDAERFEVPAATADALAKARAEGGRVIAVGTTVVRALETTGGAAGRGSTDLYLLPGYRFRAVDELITNFHLPRSTLLALVAAFAGVEATRRAYAHAIAAGFRFYSYGDAMWIR